MPSLNRFRFISPKSRKNYPDVKKLILLFSFWPLFVFGQISDDFEGGSLSSWVQHPISRWESSSDIPLSGNYSLHHTFDNSEAGTDQISVRTGIINPDSLIIWEFKLKHGYLPSTLNKWSILLACDHNLSQAEGKEPEYGWKLAVNAEGSEDSLKLYSIEKGVEKLICCTGLNYEQDCGTDVFHCKVLRMPGKGWEIYGSADGEGLKLIGNAPEDNVVNFPPLDFFRIVYSYSAARDRLFWFDDFTLNASILPDTVKPKISHIRLLDPDRIQVVFSEEVEESSFHLSSIEVYPGKSNPYRILFHGNTADLFFQNPFEQDEIYRLFISDLKDGHGNITRVAEYEFSFHLPERYDIVITEIMPDPNPAVYLVESEYIEVFNRSGYPVDLDSFTLITGRLEWSLPPYTLEAGSYLVLSDQKDKTYPSQPVFGSLNVITNDGQRIVLKDRRKKIIAEAEFHSGWFDDEYKSQGGWSLEKVDYENLCGGKENWKASMDLSGGTPGKENSVTGFLPDGIAPYVDMIAYSGGASIRINFSERIDYMAPGNLFPVSNSTLPIQSAFLPEEFPEYVDILFRNSLQAGKMEYLTLSEKIKDCAGNYLEGTREIIFGKPSGIYPLDIIQSEVMFSPLQGCEEYIEMYNQSGFLLNLEDLRIKIQKDEEGEGSFIPLNLHTLLYPDRYFVITRDKDRLLSCHFVEDPDMILECPDMPVLPDEGACIELVNRSLQPVDNFCYKKSLVYPIFHDIQGVALERLEMGRIPGELSDWHSASSVSGYGTPGAVNSQAVSENAGKPGIEVKPEIFSPDNDGKDDYSEIWYNLPGEGYSGTFAVFDNAGRIVKYLGVNELLGTSGYYIWDGYSNTGRMCGSGIYLVFAEVWDLKGHTRKYRKALVLIRKN